MRTVLRWVTMGAWVSLGQSVACKDWVGRERGKGRAVWGGGGDGLWPLLSNDLSVWEAHS